MESAVKRMKLGESVDYSSELVGPPNPRQYPPRKLEGREDEPKVDLLKTLTPMLIAQALDTLSTERPLGFMANSDPEPMLDSRTGVGYVMQGPPEANPLPGMNAGGAAGTASRLGWGLAEILLARTLLKKKPKFGNAYVKGSTAAHSALAYGNWSEKDQLDRIKRSLDPWPWNREEDSK